MGTERDTKPRVAFEDLWDWAYCPLRVWWRKRGLNPDGGRRGTRRTGEQLMRRAVQVALETYYQTARTRRSRDLSPIKALGFVWKTWLREWEVDRTLAKDLVEYHEGRRAILNRFEEAGDIRRPDGTLYRRPMWTRWWKELATSSGLLELRKHIDEQGERAGLSQVDFSPSEEAGMPMGLADAFAASFDLIERQKDLPSPDVVLDTDVELLVELLSVQLSCRAAIIVDEGKGAARGRPPKGSDGPRTKRKLGYELHIFDRDVPSPYVLARDLRVLALGQALPDQLEFEGDELAVERVYVRHMVSGEVQPFHPGFSDGADLLEALSRSYLVGARSGGYVPRMVCGWTACGDCEYRSLCFAESGVMAAFNPPLATQVQASQRMVQQVTEFVREGETWTSKTEVLRAFLRWMAKEPGLSPEGALWLLDSVETLAA